jgi:1-deoxy-D-xylulose-5-phosphate synthase
MDSHCTAIELGKGEVIRRGKDICLIALGDKVSVAMAVVKKLPYYSFTIINARFIKPLDEVLITACAQDHRKIYVLEDHVQAGGFGSAVAEFFTQRNITVSLRIFAWPNCFIPHASNSEDLEKMFHLTADDIAVSIASDFGERK